MKPLKQSRLIPIDELEARLSQYLGQPASGMSRREASSISSVNYLIHVREALRALRQDAERVGQIPLNYPRHVDMVMKTISALLPWYTRSLSQFASRTTETLRIVIDALEDIAREQEKLGARSPAHQNPLLQARPLPHEQPLTNK